MNKETLRKECMRLYDSAKTNMAENLESENVDYQSGVMVAVNEIYFRMTQRELLDDRTGGENDPRTADSERCGVLGMTRLTF